MNKSLLNEMTCTFTAVSENESFARTIAASFISGFPDRFAARRRQMRRLRSGYELHSPRLSAGFSRKRFVKMTISRFDDNSVIITISDKGIGIPDVEAARAPLYTTDTTGERSGMGFAITEEADGRLSRKVKSWFWDSRDNENQAGEPSSAKALHNAKMEGWFCRQTISHVIPNC